MSDSPKLVTIFGGSGFVGRYITRRLALEGWRIRVAVRRPNEALFVRTYGVPGQVEVITANIRDDSSTRAAIMGADAVVNCVGILQETSRQRFDQLHGEAAGRIARIAADEGVSHLVHLSSIGADANSGSDYARTKAEGEAQIKAAFPNAVILRPSLVFGPEDRFFNRFAALAKYTLVLPIVGASTKFQPVFVDDVAKAAALAANGQAVPGVYELGGPEVASFADLMRRMLKIIRRPALVLPWPFWIARINAWFFDLFQTLSMGLFTNTILTRDQVRQLRHDNIVSEGAKTFADMGIMPTPMAVELDTYLYCHRPAGQYQAIKESAEKLREI